LQYLVHHCIDVNIISMEIGGIDMAAGVNKSRVITLWIFKVLVGVAFLAAGGSKLAGVPAMVAVFAKSDSGSGFEF
jgi:hypothetical protein